MSFPLPKKPSLRNKPLCFLEEGISRKDIPSSFLFAIRLFLRNLRDLENEGETVLKPNNKQLLNRWIQYFLYLIILAFGIILNTKSGLGVSPIISVAYCVSVLTKLNFGNVTFLWYTFFVLIEMILHLVRKVPRRQLVIDGLQLVVSLIFTRIMNLISSFIPDFAEDALSPFWNGYGGRLLVLLAGILLTGIGAAGSLNMRIVPNPGDGIVQAFADATHKSNGFIKNCVDTVCVCLTILLSWTIYHGWIGIGIGTVLAVILVGRVVAFWNHLFLDKTLQHAGIFQTKKENETE